MRWIASALLVGCLSVGVAHAEFVVKYFIDGHIVAPASPTGCTTSQCPNWVAEMDGDTSSPEMLVCGKLSQWGPSWEIVGIARIATGETQWFERDEVGRYPMLQVYDVTSGDKQTLRVSPLFFDVDHDGLLDVLVPVYGISEGEGQCQTVVIGWAGPPAQADISGPATGRAALHQSRPNPTSGGMSIEFSMPTEGNVQLRIFDVAGRVVRRLVDEHLAAGEYTIPWNGRHDDGTPAGTGNYYYQLRVDGEEQARRALLMR